MTLKIESEMQAVTKYLMTLRIILFLMLPSWYCGYIEEKALLLLQLHAEMFVCKMKCPKVAATSSGKVYVGKSVCEIILLKLGNGTGEFIIVFHFILKTKMFKRKTCIW